MLYPLLAEVLVTELGEVWEIKSGQMVTVVPLRRLGTGEFPGSGWPGVDLDR